LDYCSFNRQPCRGTKYRLLFSRQRVAHSSLWCEL